MLVYQIVTAFPAVPKGGKEPVWFTRHNEHLLKDSLTATKLKDLEAAGAIRSWDDGTPEPEAEDDSKDTAPAGRAHSRKEK